MVEFRLIPVTWAVADFAFCAITTVMDVIQGVAGVTVLRGLVVLCIQVATVTGNFFMVSK